jgi:addiction module HigA family antidote
MQMLPKYRKPIHPGEILWEDFLHPLGVSQIEFVRHLGGTWTQPKLSSIIRGKRAITEAIALDLADALGTSPEFWINLQIDTNLWEAKKGRRKIRRYPKLKPQARRKKRKHQSI